MNVLVFDDFYADPLAIRKIALNAEYRDVRNLNYPGYQTVHSFTSRAVQQKLEEILGKALEISQENVTFGKFRIMLRESKSRLNVHLDGGFDWTGVLYLNPPEDCEGGTAFYRHKETGLEGAVHGEALVKFGCKTWEELENGIIERDTLRPDAWEETMFVGMKFNRLLLFRGGKHFHCHTHSFGIGKSDGRMTQNFFFNEAK